MSVIIKMNLGWESPTSSPPTPPSPLPVSYGPGNCRYSFSASSTPSPLFSMAPSTHTSADDLPLLHETFDSPNMPSVFSLERQDPLELESMGTCLKDMLEWFIRRCCSCCNKLPWSFLTPQNRSSIQWSLFKHRTCRSNDAS